MRLLDRYVVGQTVGPFLFFVLVFTGVIWLSQSLRVIDTVVNNGQSAQVFLEFTALLLPLVLSIVLPVAAFAATLYAINRLFGDSEIVTMLAAGYSTLALARPVAVFASLVMAAVFALTLYAMPTAQREMRDRISQIRGDVATAFLREGAFQNPAGGLTIYVREAGRPGEMLGIFVHDERNPAQRVTYTAERAVILSNELGTKLVMFDGVAQATNVAQPDVLSVLRFAQLSYDLGALMGNDATRTRKPSEMYLAELLSAAPDGAAGRNLGEYRAEAHEALSGPLYVLSLPLIATAFVLAGGFRRQGFAQRIAAAVLAAVVLRVLGLAVKSAVGGQAALWPLMYLPPLAGAIGALWLLGGAGRGRSGGRG